MVEIVLAVAAVAVLVALAVMKDAFKRPPERSRGRGWVLAAQILIGIYAAFWLFLTVGEVSHGEPSGLIHLPPALTAAGLLYLMWKLPLASGFVLVALGVIISAFLLVSDRSGTGISSILLLGLPYVVTGLLLVVGGSLGRSKPKKEITN